MQQPTPTIGSKLEVLSVLAQSNTLYAFGRQNSNVKLLGDYLEASLGSASQQRRRMLLREHNLLHRLSAAVGKALQLIAQGPGLAEATDDAICSICMLCSSTGLTRAHGDPAGIAACGEFFHIDQPTVWIRSMHSALPFICAKRHQCSCHK